MFGIGGGLVIVPALIFLFHESTTTAVGTSLFALIWPVGLLGVIQYWKNGDVRAAQGLMIAVGLFFGAYFGAKITLSLEQTTMKRLYAVFLLVVGVYLLVSAKPATRKPVPQPEAERVFEDGPR
jgi:uncharacterized membrane protein YfcA